MADINTDRIAAEMLAGLDGVTPGPWDVWREPTLTMADAIRELTYQVENVPVEDFAKAVYLLNAGGKRPATTGCDPTSAKNAAHIARCDPGSIRALLTERQSDKARIAEIEAENDRLREALARAQRALADLINPSADPTAPNIMATYAQIFEAEVAARKALGGDDV